MSKIDEKTEKIIFLSYSTQSKGYRVYSLESNKMIIIHDIEFDENDKYNYGNE